MKTHLFTYGTLQVPRIFHHVTGQTFPAQRAVLEGYFCTGVRGQVYPGIRPFFGAITTGKLYHHVDYAILQCLDAFEGEYYIRKPVQVRLSNGCLTKAQVYVIRKKYEPILSSLPWHLADFTAQKQELFLNAYPYMPPK